jgi:hypothetical protein
MWIKICVLVYGWFGVALKTGLIGLDSVFQRLKIAVLRTAKAAQWVKKRLMISACSFHGVVEFVDVNSLDYMNNSGARGGPVG